ncbi:alpha/beta fold hydrolase [Subtercola endophyticus]|uniref:alpha/beta fold hydrolase n=1 Tax=Subtercola endophyticus TaxID=2895559 RepID=UPI001E5EE337|nr:alpha/beta hydrolase [Subtercola endophyticus]UFS58176.1 alpha/beta hydrolase [Subtercola endophyticus]
MNESRRVVTAADGVRVSYAVFEGEGPAVVVLHGLAGSSREFVPTARRLAGRKVILVDQRGHGLSTRVPADVSRSAFVGDVIEVIEAESAEPVDLVGHSMGAHTAMLVAAARPDLVRRLVLLEGNEGSGSTADHAALGDYFRSWAVPFADQASAKKSLGDGPLQQAWVADLEERPDGLYPRFDVDVMLATSAAVARPRWKEWECISAPVLVIYADGGMFTDEQKAAFVERGNDVTRVDLAGASHDAHLDSFEPLISALRAFLLTG